MTACRSCNATKRDLDLSAVLAQLPADAANLARGRIHRARTTPIDRAEGRRLAAEGR